MDLQVLGRESDPLARSLNTVFDGITQRYDGIARRCRDLSALLNMPKTMEQIKAETLSLGDFIAETVSSIEEELPIWRENETINEKDFQGAQAEIEIIRCLLDPRNIRRSRETRETVENPGQAAECRYLTDIAFLLKRKEVRGEIRCVPICSIASQDTEGRVNMQVIVEGREIGLRVERHRDTITLDIEGPSLNKVLEKVRDRSHHFDFDEADKLLGRDAFCLFAKGMYEKIRACAKADYER